MLRNRYTLGIVYLSILLFCFSIGVHAEKKSMVRTFNAGEGGIFMIPELGAMVTKEEKTLKVIDVMPEDMRPKGYQKVDIQNGDELLMLNGKKVTSVEELEKVYPEIKEGENVQFGIRRDKKMMMISYVRGGKEIGANMQVMTIDAGAAGGGKFTQTGGNMNINLTGDVENMHPALELGLLFGQENDQVVILQVLPNNGDIFPADAVHDKDIVTKLNGKPIKTLDEFRAAYGDIKAGEKLEFTFKRGGDESAVAIAKPAGGQMQMIKHGE
ncbi:MAG: PDZ domain-containing protein [Candidatus Zixiibacteriota bacterium]